MREGRLRPHRDPSGQVSVRPQPTLAHGRFPLIGTDQGRLSTFAPERTQLVKRQGPVGPGPVQGRLDRSRTGPGRRGGACRGRQGGSISRRLRDVARGGPGWGYTIASLGVAIVYLA